MLGACCAMLQSWILGRLGALVQLRRAGRESEACCWLCSTERVQLWNEELDYKNMCWTRKGGVGGPAAAATLTATS
jgi:hypothetical protein